MVTNVEWMSAKKVLSGVCDFHFKLYLSPSPDGVELNFLPYEDMSVILPRNLVHIYKERYELYTQEILKKGIFDGTEQFVGQVLDDSRLNDLIDMIRDNMYRIETEWGLSASDYFKGVLGIMPQMVFLPKEMYLKVDELENSLGGAEIG